MKWNVCNKRYKVKVLVTQFCLTHCNAMDCSLLAPLSMEFSRQEYCSGLSFSSLGNLLSSGIEPWSPALQADSFTIWATSLNVKVTQSCPTLCDPMDYAVHGILQARILEWIAVPFSRGSSQPGDWTQVSHIADGFFTSWATNEAQESPGKPIKDVGSWQTQVT